MPARTDSFDLGRLRLTSGEGRRLELEVALDALQFGGETYDDRARRRRPRCSTSRA